jgi:2-oxoglutarate ferredoxin oxidoreductase subunit alpha
MNSEEGAVYADNMQRRLVRKFETAQDMVPRPLQANAAKPTKKYGVIYFGSTAPAMDEAIGLLRARGHRSTACASAPSRSTPAWRASSPTADFVYVVRAEPRRLVAQWIVNENGVDPVRLGADRAL